MAYELLPDDAPSGYVLLDDATPSKPKKMGKEAFADTLKQELQNADWLTRNIAGFGTAASNLFEGAKQFVGKGDANQIEANRIIEKEAPVGAFLGNLATTAIPFGVAGNSLKAAGAVGAGIGAFQPVAGEQSLENIAQGKAINTVVGGATGAAGQAVANKAGDFISKKAAEFAKRNSQQAPINSTIKESLDAGYSVPPSMMPNSGMASHVLEGLSGKYKTNQLAGIRNQDVTNSLARKSLGLADDAPLSQETVEQVRKAAYGPYRELADLPKTAAVKSDPLMNVQAQSGFNPKSALEDLKTARADAKAWYNAYNRSAHPEDLAKAKGFQAKADALETEFENYASQFGRSDLVPALQEARKMIAKTYTVDRAMQKGSGNVDAKVIGRLFEKGKPLSDGLDTVGKFGATFKDVAGVPQSGHANPFTTLDWMQGAGVGALGGGPLAFALPAARIAARYGLLSAPAQRSMAQVPNNISPAIRMTGGLLNYSPVAGTTLALDALN